MTRGAPTLEQRLRLHCWSLFNAYHGDVDAVAATACIHGEHCNDGDQWACLTAVILTDFLKDPRNQVVALAAIVASQEAA